jgi:hypothetical protein
MATNVVMCQILWTGRTGVFLSWPVSKRNAGQFESAHHLILVVHTLTII